MSKCKSLIYFAVKILLQDYIFGRFDRHRDEACLEGSSKILGLSILVLFEESLTSPLFIPCLTCGPNNFLRLKNTSLRAIRQVWDVQNRDMHKYKIFVTEDSVDVKCGLLYGGFINVGKNVAYCHISSTAEKYNLTFLPFKGNHITCNPYVKLRSFVKTWIMHYGLCSTPLSGIELNWEYF